MSDQPLASPRARIESTSLFLWAGVIAHAVMVCSLRFGFLDAFFDDSTHRRGLGADFYSVYQAAQNIEDGASIYAKEPLRQVVPYFFPYRYHPIVALTVGQFFRLLSPGAAYGVWIMLQEVVLLLNIILTRRLFAAAREANVATGLWLLFSPYFLEVYMGQFSFLMSSLLFWMLAATIQGKKTASDAFWIGSLLLKSNSALFVPVLVKSGRWRTVLVAAAAVSVLGLPYFISRPGSFAEFSSNFLEPLTMPTLQGNQGFAALLGVVLLRSSGLWPGSVYEFPERVEGMNQALEIPMTLLTLAVVVITVVITVKASRGHTLELFLLWILAYFLLYKHVWEHHYVMALPVFVFLYYRINMKSILLSQNILWSSYFIIALPTVFVFIDKASGLGDPELYWSNLESFLFHAPKPLAILALYVALSTALWKANDRSVEEKPRRMPEGRSL